MNQRLTTTIAIFSYFVLYAPQPLLPTLSAAFGTSIAQTGALMTATLIPLAIAPLLYGYLLSALSPARLIQLAVLCMGVSCFAFAFSYSYQQALLIRFLQGLLLPAVLTAITTSIGAYSEPQNLQKNMSWFVTGTILGGLFGRLLAGASASLWDWHSFYIVLAIIMCLLAFMVPQVGAKAQIRSPAVRWLHVASVVKTSGVKQLYVGILCLFFSFVALLNYLPFIVGQWITDPSELLLGLMYAGFVMGAVASLNAQRLVLWCGSAQRVIVIGYGFFLLALILFFIPSAWVMFCVLFLFCGSMFLVHSIAVAEVNRRSLEHKSIANALYVMAYYSGGVLGSYMPGLAYEYYGSKAFLCVLLAVSLCGFLCIVRLPLHSHA